jgi:hypothetical protein
MDNLEKVEVENLIPSVPSIPSIPSFNFIQEWIREHLFEIVLVMCFLALAIYKYGQKEISMSNGYKSVIDKFNHGLNKLLGKFWLTSNMEGNAIKSKVTFNEDENEEYDDDDDDDEDYQEKKPVMYI